MRANKPLKLAELQKRFQRAVCDESEPADARSLRIADRPPIPFARRLGIYRYAYFARIEESLVDDFPRLRRLLGAKPFTAMARRFVEKYPSRFASIAEVSAVLPKFLADTAPYSRRPVLAEVARFEWAEMLCAVAPILTEKVASSVDAPGGRLTLHPSVTLFESRWEVDRRAPARSVTRLLIYRLRGNVECARLSPAQWDALRAIERGAPIEKLAEVFQASRVPQPRAVRWLGQWAQWGVICGFSLS